MKLRILLCALLLGAASWAGLKTSASNRREHIPFREFDFTYTVNLPNLPKKIRSLRIWIPVASTNPHQTVKLLEMSGTVPLRITHEPEFGDRMAYAKISHLNFSAAHLTLVYRVRRQEYSVGSFRQLLVADIRPIRISSGLAQFLRPNRLVPIDGEIKRLADKVVTGRQGEIARAHAIYDYVFHNMRYDKSGTGWGHGNAVWACNAKHGNCTDFHSLFIGMMRAEHIPARFVIGFLLPPGKTEGAIPGYHCWAEFYLEGKGWIPVDISEAWLNPSNYGFFFGSVDANRVRFSAGRDITLVPPQSERTLNYFVYPYMELNGKPYTGFNDHFSFRNVTPR